MHFSSRMFSAKFQNLWLKFHTELATHAGLMKNEKLRSIFFLIKQNLPNSMILPPKNGGFKAWSHSVSKANCPFGFGTESHWGHGGYFFICMIFFSKYSSFLEVQLFL